MNSTARQLGSDQYFKKFIIWYSILLTIFPFSELAGQLLRIAEIHCKSNDLDLLKKVLGYLFFGYFFVVALFTMENARNHSIERKKDCSSSLKYNVSVIVKLGFMLIVATGMTMFISRVSVFERYPDLTEYIHRLCNG